MIIFVQIKAEAPRNMKAIKSPTDYKRCAYCGKVITNGRGSRRVYCNQACKQAAWRERKEPAAQAGSVTIACESNNGSR
jgi:hypothetical protein